MKKQTFFDRISFPTEYRTLDELKSSIVLLFITCLVFFILSSLMIVLNLFLFSKVILLGTIAYEFILFYLLNQHTRKFIEKKIKGKPKKPLGMTSSIIFGILMTLTFITLLYTMLTPTPLTENKFISLSAALAIIVLPTFFWHELVMWFKKKGLKKIKLLGLMLMLSLVFSNGALAVNETMNESSQDQGFFEQIGEGMNAINKGMTFISQVSDFINNIQTNFQNYLGLTPQQTQIVMVILILITAFLFIKFLGVIVKWLIVILIAWIIIQMIFL